ncbi:MAG: GNAT family N-acetyltransferase [Armatimonadota bacterium]
MLTIYRLPVDACISLDERHRRIRLRQCGDDLTETVAAARLLADCHGYDKIWGIVPASELEALVPLGFVCEGTIDHYFPEGPGQMAAYYLSDARAQSKYAEMENSLVARAFQQDTPSVLALPPGYFIRPATEDDIDGVHAVLRESLSSERLCADLPELLFKRSQGDAVCSLAMYCDQVIGVAAVEMDWTHAVGETANCAVLPGHHRKGLLEYLLAIVEAEVHARGLRSLYSLTRATSLGVSAAFARLGYHYRGRLINHCDFSGEWEDMNLWVKSIL